MKYRYNNTNYKKGPRRELNIQNSLPSATPLIVGMHRHDVSVMAEKCARRVVLRKTYVFNSFKAHAADNVFQFCERNRF